MPATYDSIATTTLGSATNTITFSSISGSYTDLRLVLTGVMATTVDSAYIRFNSDSGTNYSRTTLGGNGTSASSGRASSQAQIYVTNDDISTTNPTLIIIDIFSYAGSTNKTCLSTQSNDRNGAGNAHSQVGLWRSTSAITSITFTSGQNFAIGFTASLYGILKA